MPWAVRATYQSSTGAATTRSLTVPASVQAGDFLYACFYWDVNTNNTTDSSPIIDPPAGWTLINWAENLMGGVNADFYHVAYYKIASGSDPNTVYTWTPNPSNSQWREGAMVAFYHSIGAVSPSGTIEDSDSAQSDTPGSAWTAPSSTSITNGALHIISGSSWNAGSGAPPATYSEALDNASELHIGWKELGTAPVVTGTQLYNAVDDVWAAVSVIVKTPVAGTPQSGGQEVYLSGISQIARPDADITDGAWTNQAGNNTNLYASIDEATIDDADYIQSELNPSSSIVEVRLSDLVAPPSNLGRTLRYRIAKDAAAGNPINLDASVYQTLGFVESWTNNDISENFTTVQRNLTSNIADYNDLKIRFTATQQVINPPAFFLAGTGVAAASGNVTVPLPASLANGQLLILALHSSDNVSSGIAGYTSLFGMDNTTAQRVHVYYRRVTDAASETAPQVVHTAGGVIIARLYSFTGVVTSGFPYNPQPAVGNTSGGTGSLVNGSSITTTIDQSLAIFFAAFEDDPTTFSTPSGWTPVSDRHGSSLGNDAAFAMFSKVMPTAGATGAVVTNLSGGTFSGNSPKGGIVFALSPIIVPSNRRARVSWIEFEIPPPPAPTAQSDGKEIYLSGVSAGTPQSAGTEIYLSGIASQSDGKQLHIAGFSPDTGTKEVYLSGKIAQTGAVQIHISGFTVQLGATQAHIAGRTEQSAGQQIHLIAPTSSTGTNELSITGRSTQLGVQTAHISGLSTDTGTKQLHISGSVAQTAGIEIYLTAPTGITTGHEIYLTAPTPQTAGKEIYLAGRSTQLGDNQLHVSGKLAQAAAVEIYVAGKSTSVNGNTLHISGKVLQIDGFTIHLAGISTQTAGAEIYLTAPTGITTGKELYLAGRSTQIGVQPAHISGKIAQIAGTQIHIDGLAGSLVASNTLHIIGHTAQTGAQTIHFNGIVLFTNGQTIHLTGRDVNIGGTPIHVAGSASTSVGQTLALSGSIAATTGVETVIIGHTSQSFGHELAIAGQVTGISYSHPIYLLGIAQFTNGQAIHVAGREISAGTQQVYLSGAIVAQSGQTIHVSGRTSTQDGQTVHISGITDLSTGQTTWIVGHITQAGSFEIHLFGSVLDQSGQQTFISGSAEQAGSKTLYLRGEQIGGVRYINGSHQLYINSAIRLSHGSRPIFVKSSNVSVGRKTLYMEGEI